MKDMTFSKWLDQQYLQWQTKAGRRNTLTAFAQYLGIGQSLLSRYLNDDVIPNLDKAQIMAEKLGPEIYDILGLAHPDPLLKYITHNWHKLDEEKQNQIREEVENYLVHKQRTNPEPS